MSSSKPTCKYTILCDDVRREDNGKLIFLGVYLPDVIVTQIPLVIPQLVFFQLLEWPMAGHFTLHSSLDCLSDEGVGLVVTGVSVVQVERPMVAAHGIRFGNVNIQRSGDYVYRLFFENKQDVVAEYKFKVLLPPAIQQGGR